MGEWLKPTDLKSVKAARSSGVRIPLPPPIINYYSYIPSNYNLLKNSSRSTYVQTLEKHFKITTLSKDAELIIKHTVSPFAISELGSPVNSTSTQFRKTVMPLLD